MHPGAAGTVTSRAALLRGVGYFSQMLSEVGPMETARRLVLSSHPSQEFTALWERRRLDSTVEAQAPQPRLFELLDDELRDAARARLRAYDYQVDDI